MYKLQHLDNGTKLLTFKTDVRTVSLGVFVAAGCVNETAQNNGISHFIEHMLFKGTAKRSAEKIANEFENVGAQVNAYTGKELTAFYSVSLKEHLEKCAELLSDMLYNSAFDADETEREKSVVIEEIDMCEDMPDDVCLQLLSKAYYDKSPLAKTILGSKHNVSSFDGDSMREYMAQYYIPERTTIVLVGDVDDSEARDIAEKFFGRNANNTPKIITYKASAAHNKYLTKAKKTEQANFAFAFPALPYGEDNAAADIMNNCLGGGMSSRLFQAVREKLGLAYSVYSSSSGYRNDGHFTIFIGTNPSKATRAADAVKTELSKLIKNGITKTELNRAKEGIKTDRALLLERSQSIMSLYGKCVTLTGKPYDIDERIKKIMEVDLDDVNCAIAKTFDFSRACGAYVGPKNENNLLELIKL